MISYSDFQEYYMFLDDYLFNVFEEMKQCNCFSIGPYTQYEGIIEITSEYITIAYAILDENMDYTDYSNSVKIPSNIVFDNDKLHEWIQINKANESFNSRKL